jgi:hypothetical protein
MIGDINQDRFGWLYRDNGDGTHDCHSDLKGNIETMTYTKVTTVDTPVLMVRNGAITYTGPGTFAAKAALAISRRYSRA